MTATRRRAGDREGTDEIEDPLGAEILAQRTGEAGGDEIAAMVEALVAADLPVEAAAPDEPERDGRRSPAG